MSTPLPDKLEPLAKKLAEKEEPKVVVVVGAGVSYGATGRLPRAKWQGLLEHGIEYLGKNVFQNAYKKRLKESLDDAFSSDPFKLDAALECAEDIERYLTRLDPEDYRAWLKAVFGDFAVQPGKGKTLAAINDLRQAGALLLTTNYDNLLTDETGLPPVTWKERDTFLRVINRDRPGILHIHGHWRNPDSIVLGKGSYDVIGGEENFQSLFESLWLGFSWLFVGCGGGLSDPNLGRLLKWGAEWEEGRLPDYVLAKAEEIDALAARSNKFHLTFVPYAEHTDLPSILNSLTPAARLDWFVPVDEEFRGFRSPSSDKYVLRPSWQEYVDGEVPGLQAEEDVRQRLDQHGWAFVFDKASMGKTTLALRIATAERNRRAFYLDFIKLEDEDACAQADKELRRLSKKNYLLILDNVHHHPEYARGLWDWRRRHSFDSRLLLVATRVQPTAKQNTSEDFAFVEDHGSTPPVELRPTPEYLGRVMQHFYRRFGASATNPDPPLAALKEWHRNFQSLGAFCAAVLERLPELSRGNWKLPPGAASEWVWERWLDKLDEKSLQNVLAIAVFGAPEVELQVPKKVLPHPSGSDVRKLLRLGKEFVVRAKRGRLKQYHRFSIGDPSLGRLILSAQTPRVDEERIRCETAARDPMLTAYLSARLKQYNLEREPLWDAVERNLDGFIKEVWKTPLSFVAKFFRAAQGHDQITNPLWEAIERNPEKFAWSAWRTSLDFVTYFLNTARQHKRNIDLLWEAIERPPERFAEYALKWPLDQVASFLNTAQEHGRDTEQLWAAIEHQPKKLTAAAQGSSTTALAGFFRSAPQTVIETALTDFSKDHWDEVSASESLDGGTWVASRCARVGREDLRAALVTMLLQRANPRDFQNRDRAFQNVAWLLKNTSSTDSALVPPFLDVFCTKRWLRPKFTNAPGGRLTSGLRMLGLHQPSEIYRRFLHVSLDTRLEKDFYRFDQSPQKEKSQIIQLLGSAALCGWDADTPWLRRFSPDKVSALPVDVTDHPPDAVKVENWQFQLWIGLRTVVSVAERPTKMPADIINRTLDLWRNNLADTSQEPESCVHRVNQSMVTWLEECSRNDQNLLLPTTLITC